MNPIQRLFAVAAAALSFAAAAPAWAQAFPERPVRLIVPFPPGGATDALARLMGDKLEFEMFHDGTYGPITFRLNRAT